MIRRTFLTLPALAAARPAPATPPAGAPGYKLSVRVEPVFKHMALPEQMRKVAEARFHAYEFGDWRAADPTAIVALQKKLGIECACIVGNKGVNPKGMTLTRPEDREGFLAEIKASTEAAKRFETTKIVVLTGNEVPDVPRERQYRSIVEGLKRAQEIVAPAGVTMIMEVLNTLVDHKGYYLNRTAEAFDIVRDVGSPNLKILFDIYHVQIMEGNLISTIRKNIAAIGHFHVGDVPGRHEPGTGEIDYGNVFKAIQGTGFTGFVAMEYNPSKPKFRRNLGSTPLIRRGIAQNSLSGYWQRVE